MTLPSCKSDKLPKYSKAGTKAGVPLKMRITKML